MAQQVDEKTMLAIVAGVDSEKNIDVDISYGRITMQRHTYRWPTEIPSLLRMERYRVIDLVCITTSHHPVRPNELRDHCDKIATAIASHSNKPWVLLDEPWMKVLSRIFTAKSIQTFVSPEHRLDQSLNDRLFSILQERAKLK